MKKLVLILATLLLMTVTSEKSTSKPNALSSEKSKLQLVPCFYYFVKFNKKLVHTLINLENELNVINPTFAKILVLQVWQTEVGTQKIDRSSLKIFRIVIAYSSIDNKVRKSQFFDETFSLTNISINIALEMYFFILNNAKIYFINWKYNSRSYITIKAFLTIK